MTACSNKRGRAGRVITAALVGALSVGAPAVALAANGGVDLLVAPSADTFSRGEITLGGDAHYEGRNSYSATAKANGEALNITVDAVTPLGTYAADPSDYTIAVYRADESGNKVGSAVSAVVEPGKYVVEAVATSAQYEGGVVTAVVNVKGASLQGLTPYEVDPTDPADASDDSFTYTGSALEVGFQANYVPYDEGVDYSVKILKKGTDDVSNAPGVEVVDAGDYVAYVTGLGQYAGQDLEVPFTVHEFDFASATIEVDDVIASDVAPTHPTKIYVGTGDEYAELDPSLVNLAFKSSSTTSSLFKDNGKYTFTASVDKSNVNIIKNSDRDDVEVNKVAKSATFQVDGEAVKESYLVDLSKDGGFIGSNGKFNWDVIDVFMDGTELAKGTDYTVTVANAAGVPGKNGDLEGLTPGTYIVTVKVNPASAAVNYQVGGSASFKVQVVEGVVDADANAFVYLNSASEDVVLNSYEKSYDGKAVYATDFTVKLFNEENKEISDSSLAWKLYDESGKDVSATGALRAGKYTLKVTSTNYLLSGTTEIPVTINKVDLTNIKVNALKEWYGAEYLPMTSKTDGYKWADFDLRYDTGVADSDENDEAADGEGWDSLSSLPDSIQSDARLQCQVWDADEAEWVDVNYPDRCKAEGDYRIVLTGNRELALNFDFANDDYTTVVEFKVVDGSKVEFNDVNPDDWFFDVVARVAKKNWMNGYGTSSVFGPEDTITRGQVACVLYNMASASGKVNENALSYNEVFGYDTGFEDVDGKAYYGKAIAWANQAGVVNGHDGVFSPEAPVTREELAAMLANYASRIDQVDVTVEDSDEALAAMPDAGDVSDWATEVVAWAVENGIMGNNGSINPASSILRAEVAGMVCNYADLD